MQVKLSRAIVFATEAFDGMMRKGENSPAILHSLEAAAIAQTVCSEEDVLCAAVLHDTVEDAGAQIEQIEELFGKRVAALVMSETENKRVFMSPVDTWLMRKKETLQMLASSSDPGVKALWLGDKLSNMRSFYRLKCRCGDAMWDAFHQKNPHEHEKYYRAIADALAEFSQAYAYREFTALIKEIFGEKEHAED